MGKCFFNILATFAEFEVDLLRMRTREGMAIARANGKLKGKQPKLNARQRVHLLNLHRDGLHSIAEIAELLSISHAPYTANSTGPRRASHTRAPSAERRFAYAPGMAGHGPAETLPDGSPLVAVPECRQLRARVDRQADTLIRAETPVAWGHDV